MRLRESAQSGRAVTAAVAGIAVVPFVHAVTDEPSFAAGSAGAPPTAELSVDWVERVAAKVLPSVVTLQIGDDDHSELGSGVILDAGGLIMTNNHVVASVSRDRTRIDRAHTAVTLNDGRTARIRRDRRRSSKRHRGCAGPPIVRPYANLHRFLSQLRVGQPVVAVGSPLGLDGTVTEASSAP